MRIILQESNSSKDQIEDTGRRGFVLKVEEVDELPVCTRRISLLLLLLLSILTLPEFMLLSTSPGTDDAHGSRR